jgi:hypothetical protein
VGHIHKPEYWSAAGSAAVLCPGSPQALSPGEPGPHGPWLIEFDGPKIASCRQLAMSLVRYEERDVDLNEIETRDAFDTRINDSLTDALEEVSQCAEPPAILVLRMNLVGATRLCGSIDKLAREALELERSRGGVQGRIDKCINLTRPAVDLEELSLSNDPAATLARALLRLERNEEDESLAELVGQATNRLKDVHRAPAYSLIDDDPAPDREEARRLLIQQGRQLLEALRGQLPQQQEAPA